MKGNTPTNRIANMIAPTLTARVGQIRKWQLSRGLYLRVTTTPAGLSIDMARRAVRPAPAEIDAIRDAVRIAAQSAGRRLVDWQLSYDGIFGREYQPDRAVYGFKFSATIAVAPPLFEP